MSCFRGCTILTLAALGASVAVWVVVHPNSRRIAPATVSSDWQSPSISLAGGVEYHYIPEGASLVEGTKSDAILVDVDLKRPGVHVDIVSDKPTKRRNGQVYGTAHTVKDYCKSSNAIAGINGGYFGLTDGADKQAEGMLVQKGHVYTSGRWVVSTRDRSVKFLRSALAFTAEGVPVIGWATCANDGRLSVYNKPLWPASSHEFRVKSALACGPRLFAEGREAITDHEERLVSSPALPRTFVAFDRDADKSPRHMVLGIAMQMTYKDVATLLDRYFREQHHTSCYDAMCLDGGASTQLVYRAPGTMPTGHGAGDALVDTRPSLVTIPTAVLVYSK